MHLHHASALPVVLLSLLVLGQSTPAFDGKGKATWDSSRNQETTLVISGASRQ